VENKEGLPRRVDIKRTAGYYHGPPALEGLQRARGLGRNLKGDLNSFTSSSDIRDRGPARGMR